MTETGFMRCIPNAAPCRRRFALQTPSSPLRVVLVEPDIPANTGNIARTCAATGTPLHLIEPLGFRLTDRALKRAGLDYWHAVEMHRHPNFRAFLEEVHPARLFYFSTRGTCPYTVATFSAGDALVFGSETRGLSEELLSTFPGPILAIPMKEGAVRSLNLATAVAIVLFEALRQLASPL